MPRITRRQRISRRDWTEAHKEQLRGGTDYLHRAWGSPDMKVNAEDRPPWPDAETLADMRAAWEFFRPELMAEAADSLERPWGWYMFDWPVEFGPNPIAEPGCYLSREAQAEGLDSLDLLTPAALEEAKADKYLTREILNEAHERAFARRWGWWRFLSPERRDYDTPEAVQLVAIERRGGEVLTKREQQIIESGVDPYAGSCAAKVYLTRTEAEALGLPDEFIAPWDDGE